MKKIFAFIFRWGLALGLLSMTTYIRSPLLFQIREWDILIIICICLSLLIIVVPTVFKSGKSSFRFFECVAFSIAIVGILVLCIGNELSFYYKKQKVLNAPPSQLKRLGDHFIVGFVDYEAVKQLVSIGAVGGIYITQRNVKGKTFSRIKGEIDGMQNIRKTLGLPPLFVAADQEGGFVSRLTPPLVRQPTLSQVLSTSLNVEGQCKRVIHYATIQAKALSKMGVNVNLSPVVDLKIENPFNTKNTHTQIHRRAISQDKFVIANVASTYCNILRRYGVFPTLKHFPGLGNVKEDTHFYSGELNKSKEYLNKNDWYPFKEVIRSSDAFMMLGHVKLNQIDSENAASFSKKVIQGVIRQDWGHNGILMTDDLNMGAICGHDLGVGGVAVKALNAGVDLLLVSYDGDQYFKAMYALIQADNNKKLDAKIIAESAKRIGLARQKFAPYHIAVNIVKKHMNMNGVPQHESF